jgi:hypothetical protein
LGTPPATRKYNPNRFFHVLKLEIAFQHGSASFVDPFANRHWCSEGMGYALN